MSHVLLSLNAEELEILKVNTQLFKESLVGTIGALDAIKKMDDSNKDTIENLDEEIKQADKLMSIVNTLEIKLKNAENQLGY